MRLDKASGTSRIRHQDNKATLTEGLITSDACTSTETIDIAHAYIKALNGLQPFHSGRKNRVYLINILYIILFMIGHDYIISVHF